MEKEKTTTSGGGEPGSLRHRLLTVLGFVLCIILAPILVINITLIARSYINKNEVPSFGGKTCFIVLTDSMYPDIQSGDLIICDVAKAEDVQLGDVISFFDPAGNGTSVVTHQVIEILSEDGLQFRTKGINNNTEDRELVPAGSVIGVYQFRIPSAGNVAMFMQTTAGLIVCVILPMLLLVGYDMLRRRKYEKSRQQDTAALLAELEALKAEREAQNELI